MNSKKSIKNVWTAEKSKTELAHAEFDSAPGRAQNLLSSIFPAMGLGHLRFLFQQRQGQAPPMKSVDVATEQPYPFVLLPIGVPFAPIYRIVYKVSSSLALSNRPFVAGSRNR